MVLGINWKNMFYFISAVLDIRGKKTKLLRYWYWYWVVLGYFGNLGIGIGIVKDF